MKASVITPSVLAARQVFIRTLVFNLLVALSKLICGFFTNSLSMIADGFHSSLDASSNIVGIVGLTMSSKPPDKEHPYGHRKFEALSAVCISFLMFLASSEVISESFRRLFQLSHELPTVSIASYLIMACSALINTLIWRYEQKRGKELQNNLLLADAQHSLSDLFVTAGVIVSLVSIQFQFYLADVIVSILVVFFIIRAGFGIILANLGTLVDAAILDPSIIAPIVLSVPGVSGCHRIRSRGLQDSIFIDLHIQVEAHLSIHEAHRISSMVEAKIKERQPGVIEVLVHVEENTDPIELEID